MKPTKFAIALTSALTIGLLAGTSGSAEAADLKKFGGSFRGDINELADKYVDRYMKGDKLSLKDKKLPLKGKKLSLTGNKLSSTGKKLPVTGKKISATGSKLPLADKKVSAAGKNLPLVDKKSNVKGKSLSATGSNVTTTGLLGGTASDFGNKPIVKSLGKKKTSSRRSRLRKLISKYKSSGYLR